MLLTVSTPRSQTLFATARPAPPVRDGRQHLRAESPHESHHQLVRRVDPVHAQTEYGHAGGLAVALLHESWWIPWKINGLSDLADLENSREVSG